MKFSKSENLEDILFFYKKYIIENGKSQYIYVDRHASYKVNLFQDQFNEEMMTRFQRGMTKLGIGIIFANSPEAKGRVERWLQTHQYRLVKKMKLIKIRTYKEINIYLNNTYINEYNNKFSVEVKDHKDLHEELSNNELELFDELFAKESTRKLKRNGTIEYNNNKHQIPINTILKSNYTTIKKL